MDFNALSFNTVAAAALTFSISNAQADGLDKQDLRDLRRARTTMDVEAVLKRNNLTYAAIIPHFQKNARYDPETTFLVVNERDASGVLFSMKRDNPGDVDVKILFEFQNVQLSGADNQPYFALPSDLVAQGQKNCPFTAENKGCMAIDDFYLGTLYGGTTGFIFAGLKEDGEMVFGLTDYKNQPIASSFFETKDSVIVLNGTTDNVMRQFACDLPTLADKQQCIPLHLAPQLNGQR